MQCINSKYSIISYTLKKSKFAKNTTAFFVATGDYHNCVNESILPISLIFTGSHTIAVINGAKTRKTLEESFSEVFREIDQKRLIWRRLQGQH